MTEPTRLTVSRTLDAPPSVVFAVLADPSRHAELDGSGLVRNDVDAAPITAVGQVFAMDMHWERLGGDYRTENHVTQWEQDRLIAWQTSDAGTPPSGWEWVWSMERVDGGRTAVTLTYDWGKVTDPDVLARVPFPVVSQYQLEDSLDHLEAAV